MEKFRPYGVADKEWLEIFRQKLAAKPGAGDRLELPKPPPPAEKPPEAEPEPDSDDPLA
jgi:hypothetical protein